MTIAELIEHLKGEDPAREVIVASDPEGNDHRPLAGYWKGARHRDQVGLDELDDEDREAGYGEEDVISGDMTVRVLVLTPGYWPRVWRGARSRR